MERKSHLSISFPRFGVFGDRTGQGIIINKSRGFLVGMGWDGNLPRLRERKGEKASSKQASKQAPPLLFNLPQPNTNTNTKRKKKQDERERRSQSDVQTYSAKAWIYNLFPFSPFPPFPSFLHASPYLIIRTVKAITSSS
jgi:hypothetical protein